MAQSYTSSATSNGPAIGWVDYWNLLPLRHEVQRSAGHVLEQHAGAPVQVNRWLTEGKVIAAPCSSICLLRNPQHEIALPLGVASNGSVQSVYFGIHHENLPYLDLIRERQAGLREITRHALQKFPGEARKMAAFVWKAASTLPGLDPDLAPCVSWTPASATSNALGRLLYRLWFGEQAYESKVRTAELTDRGASAVAQRPLELLIGDEALVRRPAFRAVLDLGEIWRDLTDLPFVFAIWQTCGLSLSPALRQILLECAELAQARMWVDPTQYLTTWRAGSDVNGHTVDLGSYWKHIHYRLGPQHFRALAAFLALSRCLSPEQVADQAVANILRWESIAGDGSNASLPGLSL